MKKLAICAILSLSACAEQYQPTILGFDGSVVKVGIANFGDQLISTQPKRIEATHARATEFCQTKGFQKATYQQEIFDRKYVGQTLDHIAFLCE